MSETQINRSIFLVISLFVLLHCALIWNGGDHAVFNSPDASANYHFALRIFEGKPFTMPLSVSPSEARQYLFTRSTRVAGNGLLPVGFLGLIILYGYISKILFINLIPYLTVFAAAVGLYFFYKLVKHFFTPAVALVSFILLAINPAWWYYTNDSLLPNILFMSCAFAGIALFVDTSDAHAKRRTLLAGLCIAMALWVRLSEAMWLIPLLVYFSYSCVQRVNDGKAMLINFWGALLVSASSAWLVQGMLTGTFSLFGYVVPVDTAGVSGMPWSLFFPFGFHPRLIALHAVQYGLGIFWPYTFAIAIALWVSGSALLRSGQLSRVYIIGTTASAFLIMVLYGSWQVADSPNPMSVTIGTSYVRYFLPWYTLVMLPIIAAGYLKCMSYLVKNTQRILTMLFFIFAFIFLYLTVITGSPESILAKRDALRGYDMIATWVTEHTSSDAVILTAKGDKYLWPNRLVITSFTNTKAFAAAGHYRAIEGRSIYYSGVTMDEVKYAAFNERLRQEGLELGDAIYTFRDVSIYPLELVEKNAT